MTATRAAETIRSLDVWLNSTKVGTLVRTPGGFNAFSLTPAYRASGGLPILSLSLRAAAGGLRRDPRPKAGALPPFFANLLAEDRLREAMEKHHGRRVRPGNDFDLLAALGADLPGAVRVLPTTGEPVPATVAPQERPKARFSLAGAQMKLSVIRNASHCGGLTLPLADGEGRYIAKFPSTTFPGVSENEFANLALAAAVGMDVPERELVDRDQFEGIPQAFETLAEGSVLLVRRFDRGVAGQRFHIEDFAQVFGLYPTRKYDGAAYHDIASVLNAASSLSAALDFVRRLTLAVVMGNGDMHLKNVSLIYTKGGDAPELAPNYGLLSTVPYMPTAGLALSLGGERTFRALTPSHWRLFANRARLPEAAVLQAVAETARRIDAHWWTLPERATVPAAVLTRIDAHVRTMLSYQTG